MKALVVSGLLGGVLVVGSMAFGSAGAAPASGSRVAAVVVGSEQPFDASVGGLGGLLPNNLAAVSCTSANNCVAVGTYEANVSIDQTLIESWDGTAWSVVPSPAPGYKNALDAVSCTSANNCVAVGRFASGSSMDHTLVESWDGTAWSVVPSPDGSPTSENRLYGVSCSSATNCVAVGSAQSSESVSQTLIESWNGTTWSVVPSPDPGNPGSSFNNLSAVSCASAISCVAVGSWGNTSGSDATLVESWNGATWSVVPSPQPGNLNGVFCTSATNCVAVGSDENASNVSQTLIESWNGAAWSVIPSPNAGGGSANYLGAVSCASVASCVAVGSYENPALSGVYVVNSNLVESWNGTAWSVVSSPNSGNYTNSLSGASCTSATSCVAVGLYENASNYSQTLVEAWNGTSWTITPSPNVSALVAPVVGMASTPSGNGYWLADSAGDLTAHGAAADYGSMSGRALNAPMTHVVTSADGKGYWMVEADGGTFSFGDAHFYGSMGGVRLNAPVVNMAPTADGKGYWLVASDGGIFSFGDASFYGSMGGIHLNQSVVGMAGTPTGRGYWLVASDGGIFSFGDAQFYGSMGGIHLNQPVVGMAATATGAGYWLVATDGGIFTFGNAAFRGSMGGEHLNQPVVGMAADATTGGYWLVASDGGIFSFDAPFYGAG